MQSDQTEKTTQPATGASSRAVKAAARDKRLKAALRANLKRRKAQGRTRGDKAE